MNVFLTKNLLEIKPHGRVDFKMSLYEEVFTDDGIGKYALHWHPELEVDLIVDGEIEFVIGNVSYSLKTGDAIFINSNILHSINKKTKTAKFIALVFGKDFLGYDNKFYNYLNKITSSAFALKECGDEIIKIKDLFSKCPDFYEFLIAEEYVKLVRKVLLQSKGVFITEDVDSIRMKQIISYISDNYDKRITIEDLKRKLGIGKTEISRIIKQSTNFSFITYLNNYRIEKSLVLLNEDKYSITEIANLCGFNSSSYFTEVFHSLTGFTPRDYKNKKIKEKENGVF